MGSDVSVSDSDKIVVVESGAPNPEADAGSRAVVDLIEGLTLLGFTVVMETETHLRSLQAQIASQPRAVIFSRPGPMIRHSATVNRDKTLVVYLGHDLHHERLLRGAEFQSPHSAHASRAMALIEKECLSRAHLSLFPTQTEARTSERLVSGSVSAQINYYWFPTARPASRRKPKNLTFVGSVAHAPNSDGIRWFLKEVWPGVLTQHPTAQLNLVGHWTKAAEETTMQNVVVHGHLSEPALAQLLDSSTVGISPLRYGAGMKRKTVQYMAHGLPVVSTTEGASGLDEYGAQENGVAIAESESQWVQTLSQLLSHPELRSQKSQKAMAFINRWMSREEYLHRLRMALCSIGLNNNQETTLVL